MKIIEKLDLNIHYQEAYPIINHQMIMGEKDAFDFINEWILSLTPLRKDGFEYFLDGCWLANYAKGDKTFPHAHTPAVFSFVYFVKCPKGSSPLVFSTSGKRIKSEEGKLVLTNGCVRHHVPKSKCSGRIVYVGNIFSKPTNFDVDLIETSLITAKLSNPPKTSKDDG